MWEIFMCCSHVIHVLCCSIHFPLPLHLADMVEHDVSQALVIEEPHSLSDHGISESGSEQTVMEDGGEEILPGNVAETVSSFFSGFASVIQNTVSQ